MRWLYTLWLLAALGLFFWAATSRRDFTRVMGFLISAGLVVTDLMMWTMLADEVDAYLAGTALQSDDDHDALVP